MVFGTGTQLQLDISPEPKSAERPLELIPAIEPWGATFLRNFKDFLLFRDLPRPFDRRAYEGWMTAYVFTRPPWTRIRESWWAHALLAVATFAICTSPFFVPRVKLVSPFEHAHIQYYPVSEYLPPINHAAPRPHGEKRADPVLAKQEIISVRPNADNQTQTIITPPNVKLQHDVPLPNMAVTTADPVPPTVSVPSATPKMVFPLAAQVVEPAPDANALRDRRNVNLQASVVEPVASDHDVRKLGALNIANLKPDVVAPVPKLPMQAQRAAGLGAVEVVPPAPPVSASNAGKGNGKTMAAALRPQVVPPTAAAPQMTQRGAANGTLQPQVVPPAPSVGGVANTNGKASGQIIALSVKPAEIHGPIAIPEGNRNGEFAAGPNGRPGASGQPESSPDPKSSGNGSGKNAIASSGPAGVYVAPPPPTAAPAAAAGNPPTKTPPAAAGSVKFPNMHATVSDLAKTTKRSEISSDARSPLADKVFGEKRYYSLTLNMPNLNSATGSWVVRFAELNDKQDGIALLAPIATNKLDPIYPPELVRDRVEGTVTLYAIIRQDGTVGDIKVIKGVDKLLDYSAMRALAGWRFHPGMKNGNAVDLEAIVDIPFRLKSLDY
ncbi:MAG TPA: energy transducer TonB [Candidatus Koribacter sp.]|jgi:TonB family protein